MTEAEYVRTLKTAAEDYLSQVAAPDDAYPQAFARWLGLREKLSPFTFVDLCDAWLKLNAETARK